jgi:DUF917 family protein
VKYFADSLSGDLPFFGKAYASAGYGGDGGIKFDGKPEIYEISKKDKEYIIRNSVSKAIEIGRILNSTEKPLCDLIDKTDGKYIATGNIIDIDQQIINGFLNGFILIKSGNNIYKIDYQNEYLAIYRNNELIISTPDIIAILDQVTMKPITSESLIFGLRVIIVSIKTDDIWYSEEGLKLVGPKAFNIEEKQ